MEKISCSTPILFIIFNRPGLTQSVFEAIRKARPRRLYVSCDGPKENTGGEVEKCQSVRDIILKQVDWDCSVFTNFRKENLGCKLAVSSAIDWLFKNEEKGIILEDDTLPHQTFFRFCEELLAYYENDKRIMMISGDNFQFCRKRTEYSYYFSRYTHIWGWATWRRAWNYYDVDMKLWPKVKDRLLLHNVLGSKREVAYWTKIFDRVSAGKVNTWDYQWLFSCWLQNGLSVMPEANLISNIGFGFESTHTRKKSIFANLERRPVDFPLLHPPYIFRNAIADRFTERFQIGSASVYGRITNKIYDLLNDL